MVNFFTEQKHGYGWQKDKYNPKAVYYRPKAVRLPPIIDLSNFCPPVRDQNGVGACVGFGIGGMAYTVAKAGKFAVDIYSPTWLYNGARFIEGTLAQDVGAAPQDAFDWATANGLLYENYWPFKNELDKEAPSSVRVSQAIKYKDFIAVRVVNGLDGILSALSEGHCVAIGGPWSQRWERPSVETGLLDDPFGSWIDGGHETFLYGYNSAAQVLFGQNSWSTDWGKAGRYQMPFSAINWFKVNGGYDAHYIQMTATPVPPVPPKKFLCWTIG